MSSNKNVRTIEHMCNLLTYQRLTLLATLLWVNSKPHENCSTFVQAVDQVLGIKPQQTFSYNVPLTFHVVY